MTAVQKYTPGSPQDVSCSEDAFAITTSDAAELTYIVRQIYVGSAGDVKVVTSKGSTVTHVGVPAGSYISGLRIRKVFATGTTASNLVGYI